MTRLLLIALILALFAGQVFGAVDDVYTVSLLHFDGSIADESGKTWTDSGGVATSTAPKFGAGCLYLDGSAYLTGPHPSADFDPGSASWTLDWWEKPSAPEEHLRFSRDSGESGTYSGYGILSPGSFYGTSAGSSWDLASGKSVGVATSGWTHYAIVRNGDDFITFQGGAVVATWSVIAGTSHYPGQSGFILGRDRLGYAYFTGYLDEMRLSKGVARWTSAFTPPTSAYSPTVPPAEPAPKYGIALAGGRLSLSEGAGSIVSGVEDEFTVAAFHFDGDNTDQSGKTWTSAWPLVATTTAKIGAGGAYHSDFYYNLSTPDSSDFYFSDDFTVEAWYYGVGSGSVFSDSGLSFFNQGSYPTAGATETKRLCLYRDLSDVWRIRWEVVTAGGSYTASSTASFPFQQWSHFAVSRQGNTVRLFQDGALLSTLTTATVESDIADVATIMRSTSSSEQVGVVDELRISKGISRYNAAFTPDTTGFYRRVNLSKLKFSAR